MIIFDKVTKKFGSIMALSEISLQINGGEFVFIVGPSGAGKSTLLRLLAREYLPTSGKILIDDIDITKLKNEQIVYYRRKVGHVFQDFKLLDDLTVWENVCLALEVRGLPEDEVNKETERILKLFNLWRQRHLFPIQLSGGEQQRTAIARAVIGKPDILMADEPTGDLDPATAFEVIQLLDEINKWGTTVLVATHNAEVVNHFKKRVVVLKEGRIIKDKLDGRYEFT